jgi:O-antigen ligase
MEMEIPLKTREYKTEIQALESRGTAAAVARLGGAAFLLARSEINLVLALMLTLVGVLGVVFLDRVGGLPPALLAALGFSCVMAPKKFFGLDFNYAADLNFGAVPYYYLSAQDLILALIVILFRAGRWPDARERLRDLLPPVTRACLYGFILVMLCSIGYAKSRGDAVPHSLYELRGLALFVIAAHLTSRGRASVLGWILGGLSLGLILEAALVVLEYLRIITGQSSFLGITVGSFQEDLWGGGQLFRAGGTYRHPNYLAVPAGAAALLFWQVQTAFKKGLPLNRAYWPAFLSAVLCLTLTFSRAGWAAAAAGGLLYLFLNLSVYGRPWLKSLPWPVIGPILIFGLLLGLCFSGQAYDKIFHSSPINIQGRIVLNQLTMEVIKENPWLGGGIGNHAALLKDSAVAAVMSRELHLVPMAHNIYLLVASEVGLIGASLYFGLPLSLMILGVRASRARPENDLAPLAVALISSILVFLVADLFEPSLRKIEVAGLYWLLLGCLAGTLSILRRPPEAAPGAAASPGLVR